MMKSNANAENHQEKVPIPEEEKLLDQEFIDCMLEIEKKYINFKKHDKIRIEQWTKKLCQVTTNPIWKKNRNLYARLLLSNVLNRNLQEPFTRGPPEGALPKLNKAEINSKLGKQQTKPQESNFEELSSEKKATKPLGTLGNSPDINEGSSKKPENRKLFYSTTNIAEEKLTKDSSNLQIELEMLKESEKQLKSEIQQKKEENEAINKQLAEKSESEKHLKADCEEMHAVLEKVQEYFKNNEKRLEKIGNFKAVQADLEQVLDPENKQTRVFEDEKLEAQKHDFDNFLTDAYCETSKFLEKLEQFQKKTEVLRKEVEESCKNNGE